MVEMAGDQPATYGGSLNLFPARNVNCEMSVKSGFKSYALTLVFF